MGKTVRLPATCQQCRYHSPCSGFVMGEATEEERYLDEHQRLRCGVAQPLHEYLERRLLASGQFTAAVPLSVVQ